MICFGRTLHSPPRFPPPAGRPRGQAPGTISAPVNTERAVAAR